MQSKLDLEKFHPAAPQAFTVALNISVNQIALFRIASFAPFFFYGLIRLRFHAESSELIVS
jgi:hypothetical protein